MTGDLGSTPVAADRDVYVRLIADLDASGARYRLIEHAPEGRTETVSALRGHDLAHAAKCLILLVKIGKKQTRYVLAVVPGDARLDLSAVKALLGAKYVAFADTGKAEQLAGSVTGTVLPFSYDERLELIADPALLDCDELYFTPGGSTARSPSPARTTCAWPTPASPASSPPRKISRSDRGSAARLRR